MPKNQDPAEGPERRATKDYERAFLPILREWIAQVDGMAYALALAEEEFHELVKGLAPGEEAAFKLDSMTHAISKLALLRAVDQVIGVVGLGDKRDELFQRFGDILWPSTARSGSGTTGGGSDPAGSAIEQLLHLAKQRAKRDRPPAKRGPSPGPARLPPGAR